MEKLIYKIEKKIPGFMYKPNTEFHVMNNEVYVREYNFNKYFPVKRVPEFDGFDFRSFVEMGMITKESHKLEDYEYNVGNFVVYNRYGLEYFERSLIQSCNIKNEVCVILDGPILKGKNMIYVKIKNVMNGEEHIVKDKALFALSKKYWFIDSHGKIQMTYFWIKPIEDRYRIANKNCFVSYDAAERARENVKNKGLKNIEELKEFVESWKS